MKVPTIRRWVNLPESFAQIMMASKPPGLWLRSEGCPHGPIRVATSFSGNDSMFLEKGWKTFLRSRNIQKGDTIIFRYDGDETLWARIFDSDGDRVGCCMESSSSSDEDFYTNAEEAQVSSSDDEADSEDDH